MNNQLPCRVLLDLRNLTISQKSQAIIDSEERDARREETEKVADELNYMIKVMPGKFIDTFTEAMGQDAFRGKDWNRDWDAFVVKYAQAALNADFAEMGRLHYVHFMKYLEMKALDQVRGW